MGSTLASVLLGCAVAQSEEKEQELSVSPSGRPTYLSLRGQRKVGQRKATPRPRPTRIPALRVRVSRSGFSDRPSLACRKPWPHPCGQPCGRFDRLPPLPRGPGQSAGSCPQKPKPKPKPEPEPEPKPEPEPEPEPKPEPKRGDPIGWVLTHRTSTLASVASTRVGCACRASPATSLNSRRAIPTGHAEERCMRGAHVTMKARVAASFDSGQASFEGVRARHASPMRVVSSSPAPSPPAAPARRSPAG